MKIPWIRLHQKYPGYGSIKITRLRLHQTNGSPKNKTKKNLTTVILRTHLAVGVDIDSLIVVAEEELHPVGVGEGDYGVGGHRALRVLRDVDVIHAATQTNNTVMLH